MLFDFDFELIDTKRGCDAVWFRARSFHRRADVLALHRSLLAPIAVSVRREHLAGASSVLFFASSPHCARRTGRGFSFNVRSIDRDLGPCQLDIPYDRDLQ